MSKRLIRWAVANATISTVVFALAGRWTDPWLWGFGIAWAATTLYAIVPVDDDLLRERFRPPDRGADAVALAFIRILALALFVVGALDSGRWHLAPVPSALRGAAIAVMAATFCIFFRAMHENRFFSAVVRVQKERAHRVIETGPYSVVRHPGYAGVLFGLPFAGLALGSWLAAAIGVVLSLLVVRRVLFEDAFLRRNLEGYAEYATRVRQRLVPRVW